MKKHYIKKLFATVAVLLCSITANAYDFEVDGLYYNLLSATEKTCELVGSKSSIKNVSIPASVTTRGLSLKVVSIKESAFEGNTNVQTVSFVGSLMKDVSRNAFKGCTNLKQVVLSDSLEAIVAGAFDGCPIDKIVIPANIKTIGIRSLSNVYAIEIANSAEPISFADSIVTLTSAFIGRNLTKSFVTNTSISEVTFGTGITEITPSMFEGCKQIEQITIPSNIMKIGDNAFNGCENLKKLMIEDCDSVLNLGKSIILTDRREYSSGGIYVEYKRYYRGLFFNLMIKELYLGRNLVYPSSITRDYVGRTYEGTEWSDYWSRNATITYLNYNYLGSPFNGEIDSILFGEKVTQLGSFFFEEQKMESFKVPDNCTELSEYCFYNCRNLKSIDFNNCVNIKYEAFSGCEKLQQINWGKTKIIGVSAFANCSNIATVDLVDIDSIHANAFAGCLGLKKLMIGDGVKDIQQYAFSGCSNLHMVSIGDGVSSLPESCFSKCESLTWISLGANLAQIQSGAFGGCDKIVNIELKSVTPPLFDSEDELSNVNKFDATLYIPQGSTSVYEQAPVWRDFLFKEECEIPEYVYTQPDVNGSTDEEADENKDPDKNFVVKGDLTGAIINQINANAVIETLDLEAATLALDNQNIYYEYGQRVESNWDDIDVIRGAPYKSYKYYTAPTTESYSVEEKNSSGRVINVITSCFSSELTNARLNGNLKSIKLPSSLSKLGTSAIIGTNLIDLYVYSMTPPVAEASSFGNINTSTCVLHVPEGTKSAYRNAAGWKIFKNIVEPGETFNPDAGNYIMVQPTDESRKVQLAYTDTNATYQWYRYVNRKNKILDITNLFSTEYGWCEDTDNEWQTCMHDAGSVVKLSYEHSFRAGDVLSFDWAVSCEDLYDQLQIYLGDELLLAKSGEESGSFSKTIEASITEKLSFYYIKDNAVDFADDNARISNVKISSSQEQTMDIPEAIEEEVDSVLSIKAASYDGNKVFCIVTLGNGWRLRTNDFVWGYTNFIKTQPTAENLLVELDTPEERAEYQWYQRYEREVYSKKITPTSSGYFAWTETDGVWTSGNSGKGQSKSIMTATVYVEIGDTISFDYTVPAGDGGSYSGSQWFSLLVNGTATMQTFGPKEGYSDGHFDLAITNDYFYNRLNGRSNVSIGFECTRCDSEHATVSNIKHTRPSGWGEIETVEEEIVGATSAKLDESMFVKGSVVYCVVTLPDGRMLTSDEVDTNETGIDEIALESTEGYTVYNLQGILVMKTKDKTELGNLPHGIYIVNNKKQLIK